MKRTGALGAEAVRTLGRGWPGGASLGVLLMTYGSPPSVDDLPRYLFAVRGGREASPDLVAEFTGRYRVIGMSPLVAITNAQAQALGTGVASRSSDTMMRFEEAPA